MAIAGQRRACPRSDSRDPEIGRKPLTNPSACAPPLQYSTYIPALILTIQRPQSKWRPFIHRRPRCCYEFSHVRYSYALVRLTCSTARIQERSAGKILGERVILTWAYPLPIVLSGSVAYPRPRSNRFRVRPSLAHVA